VGLGFKVPFFQSCVYGMCVYGTCVSDGDGDVYNRVGGGGGRTEGGGRGMGGDVRCRECKSRLNCSRSDFLGWAEEREGP